MTAAVDIINRALQALGTRTTVSAAELLAQSSNEAIQAQMVYDSVRQRLHRMAPWGHGLCVDAIALVSAAPGTILNPSPSPGYWSPGDPQPPWLYQFRYPADCLRLLRLIPQAGASDFNSDFNSDFGPRLGSAPGGGVSIFPIGTVPVTAVPTDSCDPIRFKVGINRYPADAGGAQEENNRVILCNVPYPIAQYVLDETNPDNMDPLFQEAWVHALASQLALPLTGDKALAQMRVQSTNDLIAQARAFDGSEGPVILDSLPDWISARGYGAAGRSYAADFDWGPLWPSV